jgi:hypothetical protein
MSANDVLLIVILVVALMVVLLAPEVPAWMLASRYTQRRTSRLSYARAGVRSPLRASQARPISRSIAGYTIRCRNGAIAAM